MNLKDTFGAVMDGVTDDSIALADAMRVCAEAGEPLIVPPGVCYAPTITQPTIATKLVMIGPGRGLATIKGGISKTMCKFSGGASLIVRDIGFDTWATAFLLLANEGAAAFDLISASDCLFENIAISPISDAGQYADGGINELRFERNAVIGCGQVDGINSAGLRIDSNAIYGISLGAVTLTPLSSLLVSGNRIYNVRNNSAAHVSGITVFGRHARVVDNAVNAVQSSSAANVDQYAIYTKSSYSTIRGNTCVDAGGNAACIMTKGAYNDQNGAANAVDFGNVIADNTILIENRWAAVDSYTGITTYNGGMNIHDNIVEGVTNGIVEIAPVYAPVSGNSIHHNKIRKLAGTATKAVRGVYTSNPTLTTVKDNEISELGSGVEPQCYGVLMQNTGEGSYGPFFVERNIIRNMSCADANQTRAIALNFAAGQTFASPVVRGNVISNSQRGIRCSFQGTISGAVFKDNLISACPLENFGYSGTAPMTNTKDTGLIDWSVWWVQT
jgi:hypothetical protein